MPTVDKLLAHLSEVVASAGKPTIATAESCTGGQLAAALVSEPGLSGAFERGFVAYSVDAKCELLGLERAHVEACEGVSADIALAMAKAALANSHADVAAAITGFAGPRQADEEVGLVHVAVVGPSTTRHRELHLGEIGRAEVCNRSVVTAIELLIEQLEAR